MARNIMFDHRVSESREDSFDQFVQEPCTAASLRRGCDEYFKEKIRVRTLPEYVYSRINGNNLINASIAVPPAINKDRRLVRILNLNKLMYIFQWARSVGTWRAVFDTLPSPSDEAAVGRWVDKRMTSTARAIDKFIEVVLDVLSRYREDYPFQPTWVTTLDSFIPHQTEAPNRWAEVVGVAEGKPQWLIVLCYTVREAGTIARPTQLDSGWNAYHFPSPPDAALSLGGHPMDLRISSRATTLLPEYIHKQINHPLSHWLYLDRLYGRTAEKPPSGLSLQRRCHFELLLRTYGPSVYNWMDTWI
jgi:hypothetical protein